MAHTNTAVAGSSHEQQPGVTAVFQALTSSKQDTGALTEYNKAINKGDATFVCHQATATATQRAEPADRSVDTSPAENHAGQPSDEPKQLWMQRIGG